MSLNRASNKVVKQQHVWKWINHPSGVPTAPTKYRLAIQEITNGEVTVIDLSHDIYGKSELEKQKNRVGDM